MAIRNAIASLLFASALPCPVFADDLVVIVHAERQAELDTAEVARIYLRQRRFWDDGQRIVPVNRCSTSEERRSFVRLVFGELARNLSVYWNRQYFRGVLPPATLASDEAVKRFVASEPLAVGYIRPGMVDDSVSVVLRIDDTRGGATRPAPIHP